MEPPTYRESIRIGWTLLWRAVGSFLALLFLINVLLLFAVPELSRTGPSIWALLVPLLLATLVSLLFIMPWIVRAVLTKPFRGFHLQLIRDSGAPQRIGSLMALSGPGSNNKKEPSRVPG